jgi:hypothetical protein
MKLLIFMATFWPFISIHQERNVREFTSHIFHVIDRHFAA